MSDCYKCLMRGTIPGSAHSCCTALRKKAKDPNDPYIIKVESLLSLGLYEMKVGGSPALKIDPHGRKNFWANWPLDFDPVWISECKLYTPKDNLEKD